MEKSMRSLILNLGCFILKGPTQNFRQKLQFFFAEKASLGMWEICPKILGGYEY